MTLLKYEASSLKIEKKHVKSKTCKIKKHLLKKPKKLAVTNRIVKDLLIYLQYFNSLNYQLQDLARLQGDNIFQHVED